MHAYSYRPVVPKRPVRKRSKLKTLLVFLLILIIVAAATFILQNNETQNPHTNQQAQETQPEEEITKVEPLPSVQDAVEQYVNGNAGDYSVVVTDLETGKELASYMADESYFAASLYKLYVAYLGYMDVQSGEYNIDVQFLGNWTRKECLDKMIRESHSPCAEKMWSEQGKEASTRRLKDLFDLTGTSMVGLTTTARDVDVVLRRLHEGKELNETHTNLYMRSLKENIYRDVLPKALSDMAVYDKVGFNGLIEYHDVGIVELPSGRKVAVSLLTRSAGTRRMIELSKTIFDPLIAANR